jgi:glutaredoxin-related protein
LVDIATQTALVFFGCEDGSVDECGKDLDRKFNFMLEYKMQKKITGDVVRMVKRNEVLYGLIVRRNLNDVFSYVNFEKCLLALRKFLKEDKFTYVGIEAFLVNDDDVTMEKVISAMKAVLSAPGLELYVCWPKDLLPYQRRGSDSR